MLRALLLCVSASLATPASADMKNFYYQRMLQRKAHTGLVNGLDLFRFATPGQDLSPQTAPPKTIEERTFDQKVDPQNPKDERTFKQRYYLDTSLATGPDAPVLYFICGEATCTSRSLSGAIRSYAKKYGAAMVALEHRYYGKSQPFSNLEPANLVHLSTENALRDLAAFQQWAAVEHGLKGKWVTIGGSYPGSLAAYYRLRYPELTQGSLASSGPVLAKADFEEYDATVSRVAGQQCADAMRWVVKKVEATLKDPVELQAMKRIFKSEAVRDPIDFLYVIADMGAIAIQYGQRNAFCDAILSAGDPVQGYATIGLKLFAAFGITPVMDSFQGAESVNPADYIEGFGMRGWMWQSCNEYGYWQIAHHDPAVTVRSALIDQGYHDSVCKRLFGLDQPVDTSVVNKTLYQPLLDASTSRILFTNGSTDPWSTLSISKLNGNDTNPNTSAVLIEGAAHCDDLGSLETSGPVAEAQSMYSSLLETWLK